MLTATNDRMCLLVLGVGLDTADVVGLHLVESIHQFLELLLEATAYAAELVPLPNFTSAALQQTIRNCQLMQAYLGRAGPALSTISRSVYRIVYVCLLSKGPTDLLLALLPRCYESAAQLV